MGFQEEVSPTLNATNSCGGGVLVVNSEPIVFRDDITIKIDGGARPSQLWQEILRGHNV